jgi:hypothetical protein
VALDAGHASAHLIRTIADGGCFSLCLLGTLPEKRRRGAPQPHTEGAPKARLPWWGSGGIAPGGLWGCGAGSLAALNSLPIPAGNPDPLEEFLTGAVT